MAGSSPAGAGRACAHSASSSEAPNELWQMDFKGRIALGSGHALPSADRGRRSFALFAVHLRPAPIEQGLTVQSQLTGTFRRYGLPEAFFVDNGSPWGDGCGSAGPGSASGCSSSASSVIHSRPYHPQSRGKNERFHRTLKAEVLALRRFRDLARAAARLRRLARPSTTSSARTRRSACSVPGRAATGRARAPCPSGCRKCSTTATRSCARVSTTKDYISFKGRLWKVPQAFRGERLAIRPLTADGHYGIFFGLMARSQRST